MKSHLLVRGLLRSFVILPAVLSGSASAQCPADDAFEPNDDCLTASPVSTGTLPATVRDLSEDFFTLTVPDGDTVLINALFVTANGDIDIELYNDAGNCASEVDSGESVTDNEMVQYANTTGAGVDVTLRVLLFSGTCNDYDLVVAFAETTCLTAMDDAEEENDSCLTAVLPSANPLVGAFVQKSDMDYYGPFTLADQEEIDILVTHINADGDIDARIFDAADCTTVLDSSLSITDDEVLEYINMTGASQDVILQVELWSGDVNTDCNNYDLDIIITPFIDPCSAVIDPFEDNDSCPSAASILPGNYTGLTGQKELIDSDWYALPVASGETLNVNVVHVQNDGDFDVDFFVDCVNPSVASGAGTTDIESVSWVNNTGLVQLVRVHVFIWSGDSSNDCNNYDLDLTITPFFDPCLVPDDPFEDNDSCASAATIAPGIYAGLFGQKELIDSDWYSIPVDNFETLTVDVSHVQSSGDFDVDFFAGCATGSIANGNGTSDLENVSWLNRTGSAQLVRVHIFISPGDSSDCNDYDLTVDLQGGGQATVDFPSPLGKYSPPIVVPKRRFGRALSIDSGTLAVGGLGVWVYEDDLSGTPVLTQELADADQTLAYGAALDVSGDSIVVADMGDDDYGTNAGARIYRRVSGAWELEAVVPEGGESFFTGFGMSVSISGDRLAVGAPWTGDNHGVVHVFDRSGTSWSRVARLTASQPAVGDLFGASVDLDGPRLVVGCPGARSGVYIYNAPLPGPANFVLEAVIDESGNISPIPFPAAPVTGAFGYEVDLDENTLLVSAPYEAGRVGRVAFFERNVSTWSFASSHFSGTPTPGSYFGRKIALSGDFALVSGQYDNPIGAVHIFQRGGSGLFEEVLVQAPLEGNMGDQFGGALAIDGLRIAVSSPVDSDLEDALGSVYPADLFLQIPPETNDFCFGDGGDGLGCTDCPCGNNAPIGTIGGCLHATGNAARLISTGTPSASSDSLRFEVRDAAPIGFGILVSGASRLPASMGAPCPSGSGIISPTLDGLRCVGVNFLRHNTRATDANGDIGPTTPGWGPPSGPPGGVIASEGFAIGETRHFQVFFRVGPGTGCLTGLNTTNGTSVTVVP